MAYEFVVYEKRDRIAYVTLNRPEVHNALHPAAHKELGNIWNDFRDDPHVWVAVLTGAGDKAFCVGNDLKYTAEHPDTLQKRAEGTPGGFGGLTDRVDCWKPIIAAINGFALGGGLEIALACDIVIASDRARFGLPEPLVGLVPGAGGMHRLPRQIPLKPAFGMLLTGRQISAQEAYRLGLVNEVVPAADLKATAQRWAEDILQCAPLAVRAIKQAVLEGLGWPLRIALDRKYPLEQTVWTSQDAIEGPRAFAEKRRPHWKSC